MSADDNDMWLAVAARLLPNLDILTAHPHTPVVGEPHWPEHPRGRTTAHRTTRGYG